MSQWIVQRSTGSRSLDGWEWTWVDVAAPGEGRVWDAVDAGAAFAQAVLNNPKEQIQATDYRVLPYEGGATFNIGINVNAEEHRKEER